MAAVVTCLTLSMCMPCKVGNLLKLYKYICVQPFELLIVLQPARSHRRRRSKVFIVMRNHCIDQFSLK